MHEIIAMAVFITVLLLILGFHFLRTDQRTKRKEQLLARLMPEGDQPLRDGMRQYIDDNGSLDKFFGRFVDLSPLRRLIGDTGSTMPAARFVALSLLAGFILFILTGLFVHHLWSMLFAFAAGATAPFLYLLCRRKRREEALVEQLPDAIDMISRALRAGQSLDDALREVSRSFTSPIGDEIKRIHEETAMGLSFEAALRNFELRFSRVSDVKILCSAFVIQRETGGNLTKILDGLSHTIRERFRLRRQVQALTAEGRTSAAILGVLPLLFAGLTYLLRAEYISQLLVHPVGKQILLLAIALETLGFGIMLLLARVEA